MNTGPVHYSIMLLHYFGSEFIQIFMTMTCCYSGNDTLKRIGLNANYNNRYEMNKN